MPKTIGLLLDGWTDMSTSSYFLGMFACYPAADKKSATCPLLSFLVLNNEEDHKTAEDARLRVLFNTLKDF